MAFVKPQILAAVSANPKAVESRLVNFLLLHDLGGPMAAKVADALMDKCESGLIDHFAAELLNMALGEGNIVGTQGRATGGPSDKPGPEKTLLVKEYAYHVACTAATS